ncbi:DUF4397 domain-containing protein, partial [Polyangium sp. 15x6]|uniref:DUF4397 domain-containing protein n=1 Tax=Polyangium sp. 15x6 TaxID=3042687 RepID=UPI00249BC178
GGGTGGTGGAGGAGGAGGMGGAGGAGGGDAGVKTMPSLRFSHLSPDASPVDVCLLPAGGANEGALGPIFKQRFNDADGIRFGEVSKYVDVPEGDYTLRVVAPGAQSCDTALPGTQDVPGIEARAGEIATVAAVGQLDAPAGVQKFGALRFLDDTEPASGQTRVRFIHASPDTDDLDIGTLDTQGTFTPLFTGVGYGSTGHAKTGNYVTGAPLDKATIATRLAGQQANLFTIAGVIIEADRVVTVFAIGNRAGQPQLLRLLVCQDEAPHAQGALGMATCKLLTP